MLKIRNLIMIPIEKTIGMNDLLPEKIIEIK